MRSIKLASIICIMKFGKLTAKLREAVPVCFIENGKEVKRYKNIEIPDEIKALPFTVFKFDVPMAGAITFKIIFEANILPTEWPQARERKSRNSKAAPVAVTKALSEENQPDEPQNVMPLEVAEEPTQGTTTALAITQPNPIDAIIKVAKQAERVEEAHEPETGQSAKVAVEEIEAASEAPTTMEITYNVTGEQRKALVNAVSSFTGEPAAYQNAPTFAFAIGSYTVDRNGTLIGPTNDQLLQALAARNFLAE